MNKVIRILIKNKFAYKPDDATILYNDIVSDVRLLKSYKEVISYLSVYGITEQYICYFIWIRKIGKIHFLPIFFYFL